MDGRRRERRKVTHGSDRGAPLATTRREDEAEGDAALKRSTAKREGERGRRRGGGREKRERKKKTRLHSPQNTKSYSLNTLFLMQRSLV